MKNEVEREWHLKQTQPKDVAQAMEESWQTLSKGRRVSRPLNANSVVLDYLKADKTQKTRIESDQKNRAIEWSEFFSEVNPGRIFLFTEGIDEKAMPLPHGETLEEQVVAGGVIVRGEDGRERYSDLIFSRITPSSLPILLSVVRGTMQVGFRPSIIILGAPENNQLVNGLINDASTILFSSSYWGDSESVFRHLLRSECELVDVEWLKVALWRAQMRNVALKYNLSRINESLDAIEIRTHVDEQNRVPASGALLMGWFVSQLQSRVVSLSAKGIECITSKGRRWLLKHVPCTEGTLRGVQDCKLTFSASERNTLHESPPNVIHIYMTDEGYFETTLKTGETVSHLSGPRYEGSTKVTIRRYYTRGESTATYRDALSASLDIGDLLHTELSPAPEAPWTGGRPLPSL